MTEKLESRIAPILKGLALLIALSGVIVLPAGYWSLGYAQLVRYVETIAQVRADAVTVIATANPDLWMYQRERMQEALLRSSQQTVDYHATVRDAAGKAILSVGATPEKPALVRSAPIYDSGRVIGHVEIALSYRDLLQGSLVAALLGLLLGFALYATLGLLPLRALRRASEALAHEKEALRQSEESYRLLFDANPHPMWVFDEKSLAFLAVNDAAVAKYGWSRAEFQAMTLADIRRPEDVPALLGNLAAYTEDKLRIIRMSRHRTKGGALIDVEIHSHAVGFGGRRARVATAYDVTEIARANAALRESEERFRNLLQNVPAIAVQGYRMDGTVQYWNLASEKFYGYTAGEAIGRNLLDLIIPPEMRGDVEKAFQQMASTGQPIAASEISLMRKDGSRLAVYSSHAIVQIPGHAPELFCLDVDLTERKQAEQSLRAAEEQFRGLVEQSIAGIYIIQDGVFAYVNPRLAEIFGYGAATEMIGVDALSLFGEKDRDIAAEDMRKLLAREMPHSDYVFEALRKDGSPLQVGGHSAGASFRGRPSVIGLLQDITEKKRAEEQINRYVVQLENSFLQSVEVATALSEMRDPYTAGHERRVAEIAVAIGAELGFDARHKEGLRVAGYLHDVGKMTIPAEILARPAKLAPIEFKLIQGHAQASYDVLKNVDFPWPIAEIALQHHERMDGSGYPRGLKGEAILFDARILAVADTIEAMSSHRPYRPGLGIETALGEIERGRGTAYDPQVVDACLKLFREKKYTIPT